MDWTPVLIGVTTARSAIVGTWLSGRKTLEAVRTEQQGRLTAERTEREERHAVNEAERRRAFQFETLLGLQDALNRLGRATAFAHSENASLIRQGVVWRERLLGDEISEGHRQALIDVRTLRPRARNDGIRYDVELLENVCFDVPLADTTEDAKALFDQADARLTAALHAIGDELRSLA
jgi:hypothetical protein